MLFLNIKDLNILFMKSLAHRLCLTFFFILVFLFPISSLPKKTIRLKLVSDKKKTLKTKMNY